MNISKERMMQQIGRLQKSERITKKLLSGLSRDLLVYVYETNDVEMVTRLLKVLTPVSKKVACLYFTHFIGWVFDEKTLTFGKKAKTRAFEAKHAAAVQWLEDDANDIWVWSKANVEPPKLRAKEYAKKVTSLVTRALVDEEEGISAAELLYAILASEEITLADLMQPLAQIQGNDVEAA